MTDRGLQRARERQRGEREQASELGRPAREGGRGRETERDREKERANKRMIKIVVEQGVSEVQCNASPTISLDLVCLLLPP